MTADPLVYCREQVLRPASALSLTQLFTAPILREPALVAQALVAELLAIPESVSEPSVGYAKLAWWREQLLAEPEARIDHPVLRAVAQTRPGIQFAAADVDALLAALRGVVERTVYNTVDELWDDCRHVGAASLGLQLAVLDDDAGEALHRAHGLHYFLRLLHRYGRLTGTTPWPFPLTLQARHQVNQQNLATRLDAAAALIRDLLTDILGRLPAQSEVRCETQTPQTVPLLLMYQLEHRLLRRYRDRPKRLLAARNHRWSPADVLSLWWTSQRLRRTQRRVSPPRQ